MDNNLEKLTKKEEEIMQVLWKLGKAFVNDILRRITRTETTSQYGFDSCKKTRGQRLRGS